MIIDVWDLMGSATVARTVASGRGTAIESGASRPLRRVLVCPKDERSNRAPYLLDPERPDLSDLLDLNGDIAPDIRDRTWLMRELLLPSDIGASPFWQDPPDRRIFRDWFDYQRGVIAEMATEPRPAEHTILAVPDFLGIKTQEALLADSGFDRAQTRLLWRPVAAVLGAEETLEKAGVVSGDRVAVIDVSPDGSYADFCVLKMVRPEPGDWPAAAGWQHLVPCRSTAPEAPLTHQNNGCFFFSPVKGGKTGDNQTRFDLATAVDGTVLLPRGGTWIAQDSSILSFSPSLRNVDNAALRHKIAESLASCRIAISIGAPFRKEPPFPERVPLIREPEGRNWVLHGGIRFAIRESNGQPTYYDEMQGLFQVVRAEMEERIIPIEWIPPNSMARGGGRVSGPPVIRNLIAGSEGIQNHISFGRPSGTTHLREYIHPLSSPLGETIKVHYHATAVPGQGFAEIKVSGIPGQKADIVFDLRQMVPAFEDDGAPTTINELEAKLDRSYPPDIPRVEAQDVNAEFAKWPLVSGAVAHYLNGFRLANDAFYGPAQPELPSGRSDKERGLSILKRYNVFGSSNEHRYPRDPSFPQERFKLVFNKLADDWRRCHSPNGSIPMNDGRMNKSDFVRLIAWTYQRDNPVFASVTEAILQKAEKMAAGDVSLQPQEYTYLGNMVTCPRGTNRLFEAFLKQFQRYKSVRDKALSSKHSSKAITAPSQLPEPAPPIPDKWFGSLSKAQNEQQYRERRYPYGWEHRIHYNPATRHHEVITRRASTGQLSLPGLFPEPKTKALLADSNRKQAINNAFHAVPIKQWAKSISIALMENEEAMKDLSNAQSHAIVDAFRELMSDFLVSESSSDIHKSLFRGMLFALKRRRFDREFLSLSSATAADKISQIDSALNETKDNEGVEDYIRTLAESCLAFLHGKGNLLNLPSIVSMRDNVEETQ